MTPYQRHKAHWSKCRACDLCKHRSRVVLARGRVPADVLFIGEAPGVSEDALGKPFMGPAGKLLDRIIEQAIDGQHDYALTNLVGCIPLLDDGKKTSQPPDSAIHECNERLHEFVRLCRPIVVVSVGGLAHKWVTEAGFEHPEVFVSIIHPAAILRMDVSQRGLAVQRSIVIISDAVDEI